MSFWKDLAKDFVHDVTGGLIDLRPWHTVEVAETEAEARREEDRRAREKQEAEANARFEADLKVREARDRDPGRW